MYAVFHLGVLLDGVEEVGLADWAVRFLFLLLPVVEGLVKEVEVFNELEEHPGALHARIEVSDCGVV